MNDEYDDILLSKDVDALKLVYAAIGAEEMAKKYIELLFSNKGIIEELDDRVFAIRVTIGYFIIYKDVVDKLYYAYYDSRVLHAGLITKGRIVPSLLIRHIERLCCEA